MDSASNLDHCFERNCRAYIRFLAFAVKADAEGHQGIATIFRAAAGARKIHIDAYIKLADLVKSTADNLRQAIDAEAYEVDQLYPGYIEAAKNECSPEIRHAFLRARSALTRNIDLYEATLHELGSQGAVDCLLCSVCGSLYKGAEAVAGCAVCGAGPEALTQIR